MKGFVCGVLATLVLSATIGALYAPSPAAPASPMKLWEAYAKGNVTVTQVDVTYSRGGYPVTLPIGYRVRNTAAVPVAIDEPAMLLSPNPLQTWNPSQPTTQDGALTNYTIPAGSSVTFYYADEWLQGFVPAPPWWCTEQYQVTQADVPIVLAGEILPTVLQNLIRNPYHTSDTVNSQVDLWNHLKSYPTLVVGKVPLWTTVASTPGQVVNVTVVATNIAVRDDNDQFYGNVDAVGALVEDTIPAGWTVVPGSYSLAPTSTADNPDGTKAVTWTVDLPAANVTGRTGGDMGTPSPYNSVKIRYQLKSPRLPAGRLELPRATVDWNHDGAVDAHSAIPVLDVYRVNEPPVANAGGPYVGVEGSPITFNASLSFDPDGDPLTYRWDFQADGTWDTNWSASAVSPPLVFGHETAGVVAVEASDGELNATASATYVIENAPPVLVSDTVNSTVEGQPSTLTVTFSDPGWLDTFTAFVDWGFGFTDTFPVDASHDPPAAVGTFSVTHTYGDNYAYPVRVVVTDDGGMSLDRNVTVDVGNVPPSIVSVDATVRASFGLRVAGEKWHDVVIMVSQNGTDLGAARVVRTPGSPDNQTGWAGNLTVSLLRGFRVTLAYTPWDDPVNGQPNGDNPAWLVLRLEDGREVRLQHNFNVQHPSTWNWTVDDLLPFFAGENVTFSSKAFDPGTDDIYFHWDLGDGTNVTSVAYNNGIGPDPYPSPWGVAMFEATSTFSHTYAGPGPHTVTLTVRDDDGGETTRALPLWL